MVALLDSIEYAVRALCLSDKAAIETNPFGTGKGRALHVVGTPDDGDAQPLDAPQSAAVLEGTWQQGIGVQVDDLLNVGLQAVAQVCNASLGNTLFVLWLIDVFQVADTADCIVGTKFVK